jgi:hypothetical protein
MPFILGTTVIFSAGASYAGRDLDWVVAILIVVGNLVVLYAVEKAIQQKKADK